MSIRHVVKRGECLSKIARQHGFRSHRTIYDHPDNAALRAKRPNPDLLFPGDVVVIPTRELREETIATTRTHHFVVRRQTKILRLKLLMPDLSPLAGEPYVLTVGAREPIQGVTSGDGSLEHEVSLGDSHAILEIADRELLLHLGALNPIRDTPDDGVSGAQARLVNLGYAPGPIDGKAGRRTRAALTMFQHEHGLDVTGKPDAPTLGRLEKEHGS